MNNNNVTVLTSKKNLWLYLLIIFAFGAFIFFYVGRNGRTTVNVPPPVNVNPPVEARYGLSGKIAAVDKNFLKVEEGSFAVDVTATLFTVGIDSRTLFERQIYDKKAILAGKADLFKIKPTKVAMAAFSDIKVGDLVIITSAENFKGKTSFTASKVEIRVYQ